MVKQPKEASPPDEETEEVIRQVADRLAAARKLRGLTQAELGELAELSQQRIYELEQGTANVTVRTLVRMARVLDVDLSRLFSGLGIGTDTRFAEAIDRWVKSLEERRSFDRAFEAEVTELIERARARGVPKRPRDSAENNAERAQGAPSQSRKKP